MATLSALLCFVLAVLRRRWSGPALLALGVLLALFAAPRSGEAYFGLHEERDFRLAAGEVHDGTLVAHGDSVSIEGVVEGDLLAFTQRLVLRGEVHGSLIAAARDVQLAGDVNGTVVVVGRSVRVAGRVQGNLYGFGGEELDVERPARIGRDLAVAGEDVWIEGSVGRDVFAGGERVELGGDVDRDLHAWADSVRLRSGTRVGGDVDAVLPRGEQVQVDSGASVVGQTRSRVHHGHERRGFAKLADPRWWAWMALHIGAGFLVGLALHALLPGLFGARLETSAAYFRSLGLGFAAVVLPPLAALVLALTLVGLPLALMGLGLWAMGLYSALVVVSFLVGRGLLPPRDASWTAFGLTLLAGLVIVVLATHAPYVGPALLLLSLLSGAGLLVERVRRGWAGLTRRPD